MDSILDAVRTRLLRVLLVGPLLLFMVVSRLRRKRFPPGPRGWPAIGSMGMMDQLTHRGLAMLTKKYGGIFHLCMGFLHMITVSSPDIARQVLQVQDNIFSNRLSTIATSYLSYDRANMAFVHYGPFWRQMRKLSVMKLFSRKRGESWDSVRDEVGALVRTITLNTGSLVNMGELTFELTRDIIYRAAFGTSSNEGKDQFIRIMQEFSKLFGEFNIADVIPRWLAWIDPQGFSPRLVKARASLDGFIDKIIDDHVEKRRNGNTSADVDTDMVDELLAFYDNEAKVKESDDLQNTIKLTRDNIKGLIMDVMFGGTETVASAIEWTMAEIIRSPKDLKQVQQELTTVVGLHRFVEESDFEKLAFLKCTIKEVLRLHPPIPLLPHETSMDATIAGYHIPAKSRVNINVWAIMRDPASWADPDTFRPSRFLEEGVADFKGKNFEFIPFGSGRRSCPGMQLGLYTLQMAVAHLLHCFCWELPNGMGPTELDMGDIFGLTASKAIRLVLVPTPRLDSPLY